MKLLHNIQIEVYGSEFEKDAINDAFDFLIPFDLVKNKVKLQTTYFGPDPTTGGGKPITSYKVILTNQRQQTEFVDYLRKMLSPILRKKIVEDTLKYMDDECNAYIRLSKESLFKQELELVNDGNCFHITLSVASFPKSKEKSLEIIQQLFY